MNRIRLVATLLILALPAIARAQPVSAERTLRAGTWLFSAELGGAAFTDFQRAQVHSSDRTTIPRFERRVSARTAATFGGWISYWVTDGWALRAGMSYAPTSFSVASDGSGGRLLDDDASVTPRYASLGVWIADAAAVFRFPRSFGRITPYGLAGAGIVHYDASRDAEVPAEARRTFARGAQMGPAGLIGIGAAIPLQRHDLLLSFELTNHITRTPLADGATGESFRVGEYDMEIARETPSEPSNRVGLTSNVRLVLGVTLPIR